MGIACWSSGRCLVEALAPPLCDVTTAGSGCWRPNGASGVGKLGSSDRLRHRPSKVQTGMDSPRLKMVSIEL